jgi:endonuclease YncB( thermonuclease family)
MAALASAPMAQFAPEKAERATREKAGPDERRRTLPDAHDRRNSEIRRKATSATPGKGSSDKDLPPEERTLVINRENLAIIDGDSVLIDGREWRLLGFDAPEFVDAKCEGEHRAGMFAKRRLTERIAAAQRIEMKFWGRVDSKHRAFGELQLDSRNVGIGMIEEGYARPYDGGEIKSWCAAGVRHDLMPDVEPKR